MLMVVQCRQMTGEGIAPKLSLYSECVNLSLKPSNRRPPPFRKLILLGKQKSPTLSDFLRQ